MANILSALDVQPVPLAEAARIAKLDPETLLELVETQGDLPVGYRVTTWPSLAGPMFDPDEMLALAVIAEGIEE